MCMRLKANNSVHACIYSIMHFFCTVLWLTLVLSTDLHSFSLHLYKSLTNKSWEFSHHILSCALWAQLFDREYYCILIIPHCYHSNIAMLSVSRGGMEEILHFLFLIWTKSWTGTLAAQSRRLKCVWLQFCFVFSVKKIWRELCRKCAAFPEP